MIKIFKLLLVILVLFFTSCQNDRVPKKKVITPKVVLKPDVSINKINFYFENSASMDGYLDGNNFRQSIRRILRNAEQDSLSSYFVNTDQYPVSDILNNLSNNNIKTKGIGNSDHKFIFTNAIKNTKGNNLSIVVTDGIYSVSGGNITDVEVDIESTFKKALSKNKIETVVLKMSSTFNGTYYSETCKPGKKAIKINQVRPYYIILFGNKQVINKALKDVVIVDDLNGYSEKAHFFITNNLKVNYTVLTQGEEIKGKFRASDHGFVTQEIKDVEKFSKRGMSQKDRYFQFGIAIDYTKLSIPQSYLIDIANYSIDDNTGYKVTKLEIVSDLNKKSKSYKWIGKLNKKEKLNYSHIVIVKGKTNLYGDLKINLNINFPKWISETGSENDCNIKGDTTTTFAFDSLIRGISNAYKKVSNKDKFFELNLKINP